ncbi:nitronate monooxygenase [Sphingomonas sp. MG17]|uniref:Nitronate monooxygenase n=1 Tax=Sphingomonas tagetis TaxID=2949092 RepID=A0A9X2KMA0_9SPHN|nr:nitronate monooxygenase [Sphingomonas tagetis]MCP3731246.1 nitronate monooxygenase [Sphingomonas tagetis]
MRTSVTDLFGIDYPILNAGMGRVALPEMVAAVSNAGGLGVLGAGSSPPEVTRQMIREVRALTNKPFGANAPLALPNGLENAKVCLEEQVPVINYSMGKGDWICKAAHAYGGKVMASVTDQKFALKAQEQGCDAVIAAGYEAAGHSGSVTTFTLIPRLAEVLEIPVIGAGGIATGAQVIAALALGAGGVSMGTRFWTTQEGPMHPAWKEKAVELDVSDTLYSTKFDGIPCRQMDVPGARRMMEARTFNVFDVFRHSFQIARELQIPWPRLVLDTAKRGPREIQNMMRMSQMLKAHTHTMTSGDTNQGFTAVGMSVGMVHDVPTIAELMDRIIAEAHEAQTQLARNVLG